MVTGIGLFSGGLDSILAIKVLQEQDINIIAVTFVTPFFGSEKAEKASAYLDIDHRIIDITEIHLKMLQNPKHGYGKQLNPCIDCHAMMFRQAGKIMEQEGADFLFSGEVLGERPMSQNKKSLKLVSEESGYADVIIRPLSAKLLPETQPERDGKVDREQLLSISGRSRKPQIKLAKRFGITDYDQPAGGCLLTDKEYIRRLKELKDHNLIVKPRDAHLLNVGRHFRLADGNKIIVGRDQADNENIMEMANDSDVIMRVRDYPSPVTLIPYGGTINDINTAASICVRYSDAPGGEEVLVRYKNGGKTEEIEASAYPDERLEKIRI
ncbi:DUF814 domain-containing protein [Candidatus Poribacteria bacterium]|nr:DUF814 domain-containing protein [Candidatus Poribacteria bacterium]